MNVKIYVLLKKVSFFYYCKVFIDLVQYVKYYSVNVVKYFYVIFKYLIVQNLLLLLNCFDNELQSKICIVVKVIIEVYGFRLYFIYMYFLNIYSFIISFLLLVFYIYF